MRLELFILGITAFLIYNAYHDNKFLKLFYSYKKYYKMIFFACLGIGIYVILKKNPEKGRNLLYYANNAIKFLPIDKTSMDMLSPIIDFTNTSDQSFMESLNDIPAVQSNGLKGHHRMMNSGKQSSKRSVSETKKKYIASRQNWICGHCSSQLDHTYEIDHRIRLEYGGGNDVDNLIALCRNCHGRKTADENM
jgi:hypothetical protein